MGCKPQTVGWNEVRNDGVGGDGDGVGDGGRVPCC